MVDPETFLTELYVAVDTICKAQPALPPRLVVERTAAWTNAHKKLVWCTERRGRVIGFWLAFSAVLIIVGRLVREACTRYHWDTRPCRRP